MTVFFFFLRPVEVFTGGTSAESVIFHRCKDHEGIRTCIVSVFFAAEWVARLIWNSGAFVCAAEWVARHCCRAPDDFHKVAFARQLYE